MRAILYRLSDYSNAVLGNVLASASLEELPKVIEKILANGETRSSLEATSIDWLERRVIADGKSVGQEKLIVVQLFPRLIQEQGRSDLEIELAATTAHLGAALAIKQQPDAALEKSSRSIEIVARLVSQEGTPQLRAFLAQYLRNRGWILGEQGSWEAAFRDRDEDVSIRRVLINERKSEQRQELARSLRERGIAHVNLGRTEAALKDYDESTEILQRLIEREGKNELAEELAHSLNETAWVSATSPQDSYRNSEQAIKYGTQACELTDWKIDLMIGTLAAAYAESGDFSKAIEYLNRAIADGTGENEKVRTEMMQRFKEGKAYRHHPNAN